MDIMRFLNKNYCIYTCQKKKKKKKKKKKFFYISFNK